MKKILLLSKNNKLFSVLVIFLAIILLVTIFAPFIIPYNPFEAHLENAFKAPNGDHWFGTDKLGRDVFSRVIYGTRISLSAALILVSAVFVIG
ncbi:MAG: nickel ABC transporter permease subunit NikC, partial [Clostridiales bacterium]